IYHYHASTAAFTEFWNESFRESSFKLSRRQTWQAFISESVRQIATYNNKSLIITSGKCQIQELTRKAFEILGQEGIIECAKDHSCSECTHEYKSTADRITDDTPAAVIGIDENQSVPMLQGEDAEQAMREEIEARASAQQYISSTTNDMDIDNEKPIVNMVVMDGIIMGPRHCAYQDCDGNLENERTGVFCIIHQAMHGHLCHIKLCNNPRENNSKTCVNHQS
ncbi:hypothetical protein BDQ17DRAFT_1243042, partial [Cyathus striatus]